VSLLRTLGRNDLRLVLRDRMLAVLLAAAFGMGLGCRYALPAIDASLAASGVMPSFPGGMRFSETYPLFVAFIAFWQGALMPGTVFGFLLLDEKEDDTLTAMRVTPVPLQSYLLYRAGIPAVLAFIFALALLPLIGLGPIPWWQHLPLAVSASLVAPITALMLAMFASDKVQGLALTKVGGVSGLLILVGWFVPEPGQWALGIFPPLLTAKAYWLAREGQPLWWLPCAAAIATQLILLRWVLRRFRRVAFNDPG